MQPEEAQKWFVLLATLILMAASFTIESGPAIFLLALVAVILLGLLLEIARRLWR